jgi:hypothetical protein
MKTQLNWTRVNSDNNGNPRYVVHFLQVSPEKYNDMSLGNHYAATVKLMNKIGGRKFHNKQYGGGIVFQRYNLPETEKHIFEIIAEIDSQK